MAQAPVKAATATTVQSPRRSMFDALLQVFGPSEAEVLRALSMDALRARLQQRLLDPGLHGLVGPQAVVQAYYERLGGNPTTRVNGFYDGLTRTPVVAKESMRDGVTLPHELAHYYGADEEEARRLHDPATLPVAPRITFGR